MESTTALFNKGLPVAAGMSDLVIDFTRVEAVDSSAVSLMLAWLRSAQRQNVNLSFINVPDNLRSLANLYGVAESLSLGLDVK
jgi:phospholipid transport system transporter-binding protein